MGPWAALWLAAVVVACGAADSRTGERGGGAAGDATGAREAAAEGAGGQDGAGVRNRDAAGQRGAGRDAASGTVGEGFLVWESNRSGAWRIWTRRLDGGEPRQLSPEERGRDHCCPHISPDGTRVAYLSLPAPFREYPPGGLLGVLRLMGADGSGDRVLVPEARTHHENRAVVWREPDELIYLSAARVPVLLELSGGGPGRPLLGGPSGEWSWLIDPTLSWATTGRPNFSPYDAGRRRVAERQLLGGCQPYFTHDGRWGLWSAGAGGPLYRMDLASREVGTVLGKNDPRALDGYGYAYFPMASVDGRLFAWAASRNQHDHFRADYEVFVAESDPRTLELVGPVVRYTRHPGTDRFPDVFLEPLELGRHAGEAPLTVRLEADGGEWQWELGDGQSARGAAVEHTWGRPGRYAVRARQGGRTLRGEVTVAAAAPPRAVEAALRRNGQEVVVRFDEEIAAAEPELSFASGRQVQSWRLGEDGRSLVLELAEPLRRPERLTVGGVSDRAQRPNRLAAATLEIEPPLWPSRRQGLVFLWETGGAPNLVADPETGTERAYSLEAAGRARLDRNRAMVLDGGAFLLGAEEAAPIFRALQATNLLSVEATVTPAAARAAGGPLGAARIVAFSNRSRGQNFRLLQRGPRLAFGLRTGSRGPEANPEVPLFELPAGRATHVVVTYSPGRLVAYLDGEPEFETSDVLGDFFHWRAHPLVFGDEWGGGGGWAGTLEGVAIYDRVLDPAEVRENFLRNRTRLERRPAVERLVVEARLRDLSRPPTLEEISPYREGLVLAEYEVARVIEGSYSGERLRVVRWAILGGKPLPRPAAGQGTERLALEPFAANRQLESLYLADTLEPAPGLELYYAPDPGVK